MTQSELTPTGGRRASQLRESARRTVRIVARLLLGLGALVVLFSVFQIWGTGISQQNHQAALQRQFLAIKAGANIATPTSTTQPTVPTPSTALSHAESPALGAPIVRLEIPKIHLDQIVVEGTGGQQLHLGPGHYLSTPIPGAPGNVAIAGHRTTYGAPFYNLDRLVRGDQIHIETAFGSYSYRVVKSFFVAPSDVAVAGPNGDIALTLTTCNPRYSASQRLVVQAVLTGNPAIAAGAIVVSKNQSHLSAAARTDDASVLSTSLWGAALLLAVAGSYLLRRHFRYRLLSVIATIPIIGIVMFMFFSDLSNLLPASL